MKKMHKPMRTLLSLSVIGVLASTTVHAGGFSLYTESNGSAVGNFGAGLAAEAGDASTGWYNPAGLVLIGKQQAVFGGVGVFPSSKLTGRSTFTSDGAGAPFIENFNGINGAESAFVPSFHYALPLGENAAFGFSFVSPFGLSTDWGMASPVRYAATFTELMTMNISPEIAGRLNEHFSIGAGIDLQFARVKFNQILGAPALLLAVGESPTAFDSLSYNKGNSTGVGFHAGIMGMFNDNHTRVGFNYQSKMKHKFHGWSQLTGPLPAQTGGPSVFRVDNLFSNDIELPDIATLSLYHDVNETFALLGSVVYTGWNCFKVIQLNNVAAVDNNLNPTPVSSTSVENYSNTWRFAIGANYHVNEKLMMRAGAGYDQTPTSDAFRTVRLPDASRWAVSIGGRYQFRPDFSVDAGYTYLWAAKDSIINRTNDIGTLSTFNVNAIGKAHASLVGLQANWTIDAPATVGGK